MKQRRFRLASVLKHYEVQKQRAEFDLQNALRGLVEIDAEIAGSHRELAELAKVVDGNTAMGIAGWMSSWRKTGHLGQRLENAQARRIRQLKVVEACHETRKRWAIAEESLILLRRKIATANQQAEAHAFSVELQETILRRALGTQEDATVL